MDNQPSKGSASPISDDERDQLLKPLSRVPLALCVSGGADSMALLHLVAEWAAAGNHAGDQCYSNPFGVARRRDPRPLLMPNVSWLDGIETREPLDKVGGPAPIVVLTVDHGLRPEAADEAAFVAQEAAKLGLPHQTLKADEPPPKTGIQQWARDLRHRLILELLDAENWKLHELGLRASRFIRRRILMAHHLDDQAETVLMRLARGSGLVGLGGIYESQPLSLPAGGGRAGSLGPAVAYRPLLEVPKARLVATLISRAANWVDDPSNSDPAFERVRLRRALEALRELGISSESIGLSSRRLRDAEDSYKSFEGRWHSQIVALNDGLLGDVELGLFAARGHYAGVRLLQRLLAAFGGTSRPAELSKVERLAEKLLGTGGGFSGATLGGCRIQLDGKFRDGRLLIYREGNGAGLPSVALAAGQSIVWDARFRVEASGSAQEDVLVRALGAEGWAQLKREVEGLDELKLKAAAMATLPAIWLDEKIISVPFLNDHLAEPDASRKAARAWSKSLKPGAREYKAIFVGTIQGVKSPT
jgi:tRNA(Ile)-lysidine synthase